MKVTPETAGKYYCKASINGFPEIGAEVTIYIKGPPSINSSRKQIGSPGDTSQLECVATSIPKAKQVTWYFNGKEINGSNEDGYSILESSFPFSVRSVLVITHSEGKHFGKYNCSVVNDYGLDNAEIEFSSQSK